jgi:hypothetical protein
MSRTPPSSCRQGLSPGASEPSVARARSSDPAPKPRPSRTTPPPRLHAPSRRNSTYALLHIAASCEPKWPAPAHWPTRLRSYSPQAADAAPTVGQPRRMSNAAAPPPPCRRRRPPAAPSRRVAATRPPPHRGHATRKEAAAARGTPPALMPDGRPLLLAEVTAPRTLQPPAAAAQTRRNRIRTPGTRICSRAAAPNAHPPGPRYRPRRPPPASARCRGVSRSPSSRSSRHTRQFLHAWQWCRHDRRIRPPRRSGREQPKNRQKASPPPS